MALVRNSQNNSTASTRYRDPFQMARELMSWDPFFAGRPASAFSPSFEVKETTDSFVVKADLPGVSESELDISLHNSILTVTGSRQAEERREGESYALYERQFGSFSRSFSLPEMADGERIDAKLENGVLTLTIGKKADAKPKKIAVKK